MEARSYQLELLEHLTEENGIIYLPTGAGKTYVAILAIKRFSKDMNKLIKDGGKRGIFMCSTVELARQQTMEIRKHTNLKVGLYTGERELDNWSAIKWAEEINENQVFVGTPQVFLDLIAANYLKITDLSIVVIDECHHGTKKHPMHEFMRMFQFAEQTKLPRVIGLTGVLIKGNKLTHIMKSLHDLEVTYRGNIVTVGNKAEFLNVLVYSTSPREQFLYFTVLPSCDSLMIDLTIRNSIWKCTKLVDEFDVGVLPLKYANNLNDKQDPTKKKFCKNLLKDFLYHLGEYGLYCALFVLEEAIFDLQMKQRLAELSSIRRLFSVVINELNVLLNFIVEKLRAYVDKGTNAKSKDFHKIEVIMALSTPKVVSLLQYIKSVYASKCTKKMSCLVFVERRMTAKSICCVIQKFANLTPGLKHALRPDFMVGRNAGVQGRLELLIERQYAKKVMADFRSGACNMIICSNVLEEGIDVQACNLVITFDLLKTFNAYIQTKGRARTKDAVFVMMTPRTHETQVLKQVLEYKKAYSEIQEFLVGRIIVAEEPSELELAQQFADRFQPLRTKSGACLLASGALRLLHRYTQLLPRDVGGTMPPIFLKSETANKPGYVVSVKLPALSRVKEEIQSDVMENVRLAKISAAFKACKRLYEVGELNDALLPVSAADCLKDVGADLFQHWAQHKDITDAEVGKTKRRVYEHKCPAELFNAMPVLGEISYAYEIFLKPEFTGNAHMAAALQMANNYAILTRKQLPALAAIPLFADQGLLYAQIAEQPAEIIIQTPEELLQLKKFQLTIWRDILQCWRSYYVLDKQSFLVVPLKKGAIDWQLVQQYDCLPNLCAPTLSERQSLKLKPEDWLGKVIGKWYTQDSSERFVVTKILPDQTPLSAVTTQKHAEHKTYKEYFEQRYKERIESIFNTNQFLIEATPLITRRNFVTNVNTKTGKGVVPAQTLVPELCYKFEYPSELWLKTYFLPSILHRLHYLLHAEHLRQRFNEFLGLDEKFREAYKPQSLRIDQSLRRVNAEKSNEAQLTKALQTDFSKEKLFEQFITPLIHNRKSNSVYPTQLQSLKGFLDNLDKACTKLKDNEACEYNNKHLEMPAGFDKVQGQKITINILELNTANAKGAEQCNILSALTTAETNDIFDMERLELLGDAFLKFSIALYLMHKYPKWHEGFLSEIKGKLVSNQNLVYCLLETDIPTRISSVAFSLQTFRPPLASLPLNVLQAYEREPDLQTLITPSDLFYIELSQSEVLSGNCNAQNLLRFKTYAPQRKQLLSNGLKSQTDKDSNLLLRKDVRCDKQLADTLEALLGVCVKSYGIHKAFRMLEFFGILRAESNVKTFSDLLQLELSSTHLRANISQREVDAYLVNHEILERNLGYKFRDRAYLLQALTHPTYPTNRLTGCYQALEFIGDAILDFLVSCYIFERHETKNPGMLTDMRAALVSNITLACICVRHRFHLFLLAENALLAESIKLFADFQATQNYRLNDLLIDEACLYKNNGQAQVSNTAACIEVPKVLADIVEALIAAVYLDSRCLLTTWHVVFKLLEHEFEEFNHKVPIDPVRQLFEHPTAKPSFCDAIVQNNNTLVKCTFYHCGKVTTVNGLGANKYQAKRSAAMYAIRMLNKSSKN